MKAARTASVIVLITLLGSCGGNDGNNTSETTASAPAVENETTITLPEAEGESSDYFPVAEAEQWAHELLLSPEDLPGDGWKVIERDEFGSDEDDDFDYEAFAAEEPACKQLSDLGDLGGILSSSATEDDAAPGHSQVKIENALSDSLLPESVEIEIQIERTVAEVEGPFGLLKDLLESSETHTCLLKIFDAAFADSAGTDSDIEVTVALREASSEAPNNGAIMAFDIDIVSSGTEFQMVMEYYLWPYGNAGITATFLGSPESINAGLTGPTLDAIVNKMEASAEG